MPRVFGKNPNQTRGLNLLLTIITVVVCILAIEGIARLAIYVKYGDPNRGRHNLHQEYSPYLLFKGKNSDVLERSYSSDCQTTRALVLGGSTAQQMGKHLVQDAFKRIMGREVCVVNLAQGGYLINQELVMLSLKGMKLKPDVIITLDGANDIVGVTKSGKPGINYAAQFVKMAVERPYLNCFRSIASHFQFINAIVKLRERNLEISRQSKDRLIRATVDNWLSGIERIDTIAKGLDASYIQVLQPYLYLKRTITKEEASSVAANYKYRHDFLAQTFQKMWTRNLDLKASMGAYVVNGNEAFSRIPTRCFVDEVHLNQRGKKVLMEYIIREAMRQGFSITAN